MPVMRRLHVGGTTYDTVGEASVTQVQTSGTKIATVSIDGTSTDIYAPEGGGGSLVVPTYTLTGETTATCDMTFAQVLAAVEDGTCTYAMLDAGQQDTLLPMTIAEVSASSIVFFQVIYRASAINVMLVQHQASRIAISYRDINVPEEISPATAAPSMDGTAAVGSSVKYAREDHVHPTDTSRQATLVSGTNIKTVNGTSLLGSGNLSTAELPSVTASDNGRVLRVVNGAWAAASLPSASGVSF